MTTSLLQRYRHILDGTLWVSMAEALIVPTGIIITVFLTRRLGPESYGLFTLAASLIAWLQFGLGSLFDRATIKFVSQAQSWQPVGTTVLRLQLVAGTGAMLLLWVLARPLAALLNEPQLALYIALFAVDIPLFCMGRAHQSILVGLNNFRQRAVISSVRWLVRMMLIVLLVELGFSITGAIVGSIGASLAELLVSRYFVQPSLLATGGFPVGRLWEFVAPLFLFSVGMLLFSKLDLFMLKAMGGTTALAGIYGAAQNLARIPQIFVRSFSPLLLSTLNQTLHQNTKSEAAGMARNALRLMLLLLPLGGITAGAAPEIVLLIFGAAYLPAAPLLTLLIFAALAQATLRLVSTTLTAADKPNWAMWLAIPLAPAAVLVHLLLIPRLGAAGAAAGTLGLAAVGALAGVIVVRKIWGIWPPVYTLVRSGIITVTLYLITSAWITPGIWVLPKLGLMLLLSGLLFLILGEFSAREIALGKSVINRRGWRNQPPVNV